MTDSDLASADHQTIPQNQTSEQPCDDQQSALQRPREAVKFNDRVRQAVFCTVDDDNTG